MARRAARSPGSIAIRRCRASEGARVLALWRAAGSTPGVTDSLVDVGRVIAGRTSFLLVAVQDDEVIGSVIASFDGWRGQLYRLAVHPAHRRRGIARALVEAALTRLARRGAVRIMAIVERDRGVAQRFWKSAGFAPDPTTVRFLRNLPGVL